MSQPQVCRCVLRLVRASDQVCGFLREVPPPPHALSLLPRMLLPLQLCLLPKRIGLGGRGHGGGTQDAESTFRLNRGLQRRPPSVCLPWTETSTPCCPPLWTINAEHIG
ncbi:hypothetical protein AB205_0173140 [Aquarana catesbeiana]|uniref:Uncharacterized protein n=1 Tax=Aquarana catesbeiana TaxID=8400 RepID=A0A2G9R492_AQUCT|nr:hypothetical protein AB205_0173140 [Aquarana catesbeiana]